jgi:AAA family ATP:ADP antiporter
MIYTTVDPESRYKAKSFIDTTVYRGNDAVSGWLTAGIRAGGGLIAVIAAGVFVAAIWATTGYRIGRRHDERMATNQPA